MHLHYEKAATLERTCSTCSKSVCLLILSLLIGNAACVILLDLKQLKEMIAIFTTHPAMFVPYNLVCSLQSSNVSSTQLHSGPVLLIFFVL